MKTIKDLSDFKSILQKEDAFYLYKHSTTCPVSFRAEENINRFIQLNPRDFGSKLYLILVIEQRELSSYIAEHFSIKHESPQILLIKEGQCLWHTSHSSINEEILTEKLSIIGSN